MPNLLPQWRGYFVAYHAWVQPTINLHIRLWHQNLLLFFSNCNHNFSPERDFIKKKSVGYKLEISMDYI